ncbi:hypothetical protein [Anaerosolibacter sp.]|uniref:hypothetical protein n=1 Tax=Anaerosolibacter sp. TaxID=1872527 RepID=UPI0039EE7F88
MLSRGYRKLWQDIELLFKKVVRGSDNPTLIIAHEIGATMDINAIENINGGE